MKQTVCTALGLAGAALSWALGGWDSALIALLICMAVDYISGSLVALVFHNSPKTDSGRYLSAYGFQGLCKKFLMLLLVLAAVQMDQVMGSDYVRDAVCIGLCTNELLSITENLGLAGVPLPQAIIQALEQLQKK